jgi:hypothetical protein
MLAISAENLTRLRNGITMAIGKIAPSQGAEIAQQHGAWIDRYNPTFGPGVRDRFAWIRTIGPKEVASAKLAREHLVRHINELLRDDTRSWHCRRLLPSPAT